MIGFTSFRILIDSLFSILGISTVGTIAFYLYILVLFVQALPYFTKTITFPRTIFFMAWILYCVVSAKRTTMDSALYLSYIKYILVFGGAYLLLGQTAFRYSSIAKEELYKLPAVLNIVGMLNYSIIRYSGAGLSGAAASADYSMELSYANLVPALICTVILLAGDLDKHGEKSNRAVITVDRPAESLHRNIPAVTYTVMLLSGDWNNRRLNSKVNILNDRRLFYLINMAIAYVLVFLGGSRGPVMVLGIMAIFSSIYSIVRHKNKLMIALFIIAGFFAIAFLAIAFDFVSFNASNRIVRLLMNKDILDTSGREHYAEAAIAGIKEHTWLGTGVFRDRIYIYDRFHRSYAINSFGSYPHNILLEFLLQFGVIIGTGLLFFILHMIRSAYKGVDETKAQEVFLYILGVGIMPLLVSKSYVQTWEFYLLLGYLIESATKRDHRYLFSYLHERT